MVINNGRVLCAVFLALFLSFCYLPTAQAQLPPDEDYDQIIVNSEDWRDVYSAILYGNFAGKTTKFLVSTKHAQIILFEIAKGTEVLVLSSDNLPYQVGYESLLQAEGYPAIERFYGFGTMNIELAKELQDITNFIIIDPSYGYNAISVTPYAVQSRSFVLFVDEDNIGEVEDFLTARDPDQLILYGNLDREVRDRLQAFGPDVINHEGDRYLNNIEVVRRFLENSQTKQVILSNGEFIEQEVMAGSQAVLFIGTGNVPDVIKDFIKESEIEVGVLIGNQYVGSATSIRRQTGISVFVKFARGARNPTGPVAQVEGLDLFYLPSYAPRISIFSIVYNQISSRFEVTIKNEAPFPTYLRGTYTIVSGDNEKQRIGDVEAVFLDGNKYKTIGYDVGQLTGEITADASVLFGESPSSLDFLLEQTGILVETTSILDNSQIEIQEVYYDAVHDRFVVVLFNPGEVAVYVDVEIFDLTIAGDEVIITGGELVRVEPGTVGRVFLPAVLEDEDYGDNEQLNLRVLYGQREEYLLKTLLGKMELTVKAVDYLLWALGGLVLCLILLFFLLFFRRRRVHEREKRWSSKSRGSRLRGSSRKKRRRR